MKKFALLILFLIPLLISAQNVRIQQLRSTGQPAGKTILTDGVGSFVFGNNGSIVAITYNGDTLRIAQGDTIYQVKVVPSGAEAYLTDSTYIKQHIRNDLPADTATIPGLLQFVIDHSTPLKGDTGATGLSAYQVAVQNGFSGTESEWLNSLIGPQGIQGEIGPQGPAGADGTNGTTPGKMYYFKNMASSSPSGFKGLQNVPPNGTEFDQYVSVASGSQLIEQFITIPADPGTLSLKAGTWNFNGFGYVSSADGETTVRLEVWKYASNATETKLFELATPEINNTTVQEIAASYTQSADIALLTDDRLFIKVYGETTNVSGVDCHFVFDGNLHASNISTPIGLTNDNWGSQVVVTGPGLTGNGTAANPLAAAVTSVNGQTGTVTIVAPVTSVNGQTGTVTIVAPVTSVNGQTGAVTVNSAVTSVNGQTGTVTLTFPVTSVNGQTGTVTIPYQTATQTTITDTGNYFPVDNVEYALQQLGASVASGGDNWGTQSVTVSTGLSGNGTPSSPLAVTITGNATHTGDVTGSGALTIVNDIIDYARVATGLKGATTDNDGAWDFAASGIVNATISTAVTVSFTNLQVNKSLKIKLVVSTGGSITWPSGCVVLSGSATIAAGSTYYIFLDCWASDLVLVSITKSA